MSIFKKKQKSIYYFQPRIDFNDTAIEPIAHSDQLKPDPVPPSPPLQKVTFEGETLPSKTADISSKTAVITTGFVADS